jgi:hypothetical protein
MKPLLPRSHCPLPVSETHTEKNENENKNENKNEGTGDYWEQGRPGHAVARRLSERVLCLGDWRAFSIQNCFIEDREKRTRNKGIKNKGALRLLSLSDTIPRSV